MMLLLIKSNFVLVGISYKAWNEYPSKNLFKKFKLNNYE